MRFRLSSATPLLFVAMWATGFVVARLVVPFAGPLTFLTMRFTGAALALALLAAVSGARWPGTPRAWLEAIGIGVLFQAVYAGGVFWAISHGLPAGVSALIAATQPLLTAIVARPLLGEPVSGRRWLGIATGFVGVALVLAPKLGGPAAYPAATLVASLVSVAAITLGTIWQKRSGGALDLRSAASIHFGASAILTGAVALLTEHEPIRSTPELWLGLSWSVFGLSLGAVGLLLVMLRRGAVVGVASWLFLVPPVAAVMAHLAFGETLTTTQVLGMAVATLGVALATRP